MGIIIRHMYNNQMWSAPCKRPNEDTSCSLCFNPNVNIRGPELADAVCSGQCWEQELRTSYEWGCATGRGFGNRAHPGMKAFFAFKQQNGTYTLWGRTTVRSVNVPPMGKLHSAKERYANYIRFDSFEPLPREKWVNNLTAKELVGAEFRMGTYRFITAYQEDRLEKLIEGAGLQKAPEKSDTVLSHIKLKLVLTPTMYRTLESAANDDGRQIDEIVREAIAEWLRRR